MKLSVVIPCYNGAATIGAQLDALAAQEWDEPWEVLVADNGSTDNTREIVEQYVGCVPNLRVIDASAHKGASYARNMGVAAVQADFVAFLDADDVAAPGWVAAIGNALKQFDFVASRFDMSCLNWGEYQSYISGTQTLGLQKLWYPPYCPHSGGSGLGIKRAIHMAVGGFDESMNQLEDTDYCIRVQQQGIPLQFIPDAVVYVRNRTTLYGIYTQSKGYAKYNVGLSKKYRSHGQPIKHPWRQYFQDWIKLLKQMRKIHHKSGQAQTAWRLGRQIGRFQGILKYRVPPV